MPRRDGGRGAFPRRQWALATPEGLSRSLLARERPASWRLHLSGRRRLDADIDRIGRELVSAGCIPLKERGGNI